MLLRIGLVLFRNQEKLLRSKTMNADFLLARRVILAHPYYSAVGLARTMLDGEDFTRADAINACKAGSANGVGVHRARVLHKRLTVKIQPPNLYGEVNFKTRFDSPAH